MAAVQGVIWDVDGTLVESNDLHAQAWHDAFRQQGREIAFERIRRLIGAGSDKLYQELTGESIDSPAGKAASAACKKAFKEKYLPQVRPFPKAADIVARVKQAGLRQAVASSARREDLESLLNIAGVPELLETSTTSEEADRSKPDPDIVAAALEKLGLPSEATVMIGDTPYDVEAGVRAGLTVIAVRSGGWADQDLSGAKAIYDNVADLLARFDESPLSR